MQNHIDLVFEQGSQKSRSALEALASLAKVEGVKRIEAFDNSHTMGANQVSAMVVFVNGAARRRRHTANTRSKSAVQGDDIGANEGNLVSEVPEDARRRRIDRIGPTSSSWTAD
ncbi:MAG: hypothetical protein MZU97_19110 [Bacillus subtilis]|nr:hypothetical protein [Bacillus subtilis]